MTGAPASASGSHRRPSFPATSGSLGARASARAPQGGDAGEPTTLLLARHGRTPATEQGRFAGRDGADLPLSQLGEQDADHLAALLHGLGRPGSVLPDVEAPAVVVASPMRRTLQTAQTAAGRLGLDVVADPGWVEAAFGDWEDLTYGEVARRYPAELTAWQGSLTVAPPGGEPLVALLTRVGEARRRLVQRFPGQVVVVVTHATPVRAVVHEAMAAGDAALWRTRITPAGLTAVRYWQDGGIEVVTVNATGHLAGRGEDPPAVG